MFDARSRDGFNDDDDVGVEKALINSMLFVSTKAVCEIEFTTLRVRRLLSLLTAVPVEPKSKQIIIRLHD